MASPSVRARYSATSEFTTTRGEKPTQCRVCLRACSLLPLMKSCWSHQLKALDPVYPVQCDPRPVACPCSHNGANLSASSSYRGSTYGSTWCISTFCSPFLTALGSARTEDGIFLFPKHTCSKAHQSLRYNSPPRRTRTPPNNCFSLDIFAQQVVLQVPLYTNASCYCCTFLALIVMSWSHNGVSCELAAIIVIIQKTQSIFNVPILTSFVQWGC